eukprot:TRINITY_DN9098_c0_g1_i2.p1 TRINITY_DN9098_c0_g1~~TRINITY_DN9098_c0_g1_i2.p1  ORF type:complete len:384 (-),score=41.30 TRINITY_DN9098_c0_g1_i2:311-1462(-)
MIQSRNAVAPTVTVAVDQKRGSCKRGCLGFTTFLLWALAVAAAVVFSVMRGVTMAWIALFVALGCTYLSFVIVSFVAGTFRYLLQLKASTSAYVDIQQNQLLQPALGMNCECYHYETRVRSYRDSNGHWRYETHQEKVVTFRGHETFGYNSWADTSGKLEGLENFFLLRIKMEPVVLMADEATAIAYQAHYDRFCAENRHRDQHFWSDTYINVPGFVDRVMSINESVRKRPFLLHSGYYALATFLSLSFFYGLWVDRISNYVRFRIVKQVSELSQARCLCNSFFRWASERARCHKHTTEIFLPNIFRWCIDLEGRRIIMEMNSMSSSVRSNRFEQIKSAKHTHAAKEDLSPHTKVHVSFWETNSSVTSTPQFLVGHNRLLISK